jgi:endonuclease/exonuclease/phosphatase family metal-dependent hydrolase
MHSLALVLVGILQLGAGLQAQEQRLRLLHHNIYGEAKGRKVERVDAYFAWASAQRVDAVTMNEANGWHALGVAPRELARKHGFRYFELLETNLGYDLAVASRIPMGRGNASTTHGFHHGLLHVVLWPPPDPSNVEAQDSAAASPPPLHVLVTHLSPHSTAVRLQEAQRVCAVAAHLSVSGHGALLVGDLNTLSRHDVSRHDETFLATLKSSRRLAAKFLRRARDDGNATEDRECFRNVNDPAMSPFESTNACMLKFDAEVIDYRPMDELLTCFVDLAVRPSSVMPFSGSKNECGQAIGGFTLGVVANGTATRKILARNGMLNLPAVTVPTLIRDDPMHAAPMRLDYIMATPSIAAPWQRAQAFNDLQQGHTCQYGGSVEPLVKVLVSDETSVMSDHYPLLLRPRQNPLAE